MASSRQACIGYWSESPFGAASVYPLPSPAAELPELHHLGLCPGTFLSGTITQCCRSVPLSCASVAGGRPPRGAGADAGAEPRTGNAAWYCCTELGRTYFSMRKMAAPSRRRVRHGKRGLFVPRETHRGARRERAAGPAAMPRSGCGARTLRDSLDGRNRWCAITWRSTPSP